MSFILPLQLPKRITDITDGYFQEFDRVDAADFTRLNEAGIALHGNKNATIYIKRGSTNLGRILIQNGGDNNTFVFGGHAAADQCNISIRTLGSNAHVIMPAMATPFIFTDIFLRSHKQCLFVGPGTTSVGAAIELHDIDKRLIIGDDCMFSSEVNIRNHDMHTIFDTESQHVLNNDAADMVFERHVWIGYRAVVLCAPTIGIGSIVAACSLVNRPVLPFSIVGGVPAREIKTGVSWSRTLGYASTVDMQLSREFSN